MKFNHIKASRIRVTIFLTLVTLLLITATTLAQSGGDFSLTGWVISNGGGESSGGAFAVNASLGQVDAGGLMEGGQFGLIGGLGSPENSGPTRPPAGHDVYLPVVVVK